MLPFWGNFETYSRQHCLFTEIKLHYIYMSKRVMLWALYQSGKFPKRVATGGGHMIQFKHFIWFVVPNVAQ